MVGKRMVLSGFNNYPQTICDVFPAYRYSDLFNMQNPSIARGLGGSYGDAALNETGQVVLLKYLNRFLEFDRARGILTAEAGVSLLEILKLILPSDWFLPVSPGTQYVTLGGCVAADVHGKNHYHAGSMSAFVRWFELITADGKTLRCSAKENSEVFWATIGGMGLTGIISVISLQLLSVSSNKMWVNNSAVNGLENILEVLGQDNNQYKYKIAWLDTLAKGKDLGRAIIMSANHAIKDEVADENNSSFSTGWSAILPRYFPKGILNPVMIKAFNYIYYQKMLRNSQALNSLASYFYPLDKLKYWQRAYGKRGFIQYQCVFPKETSLEGMKSILEKIHTTRNHIFLATVKRLGDSNAAHLSFPMPGFSLALDIPIKNNEIFLK